MAGKKAKTNNTNKEAYSAESDIPMFKSIEGCPFGIVKRKANDYVVVFGKNMISNKSFISERQATEWVNKTDWNSMLNVIGIYIEEWYKQKEKTKTLGGNNNE